MNYLLTPLHVHFDLGFGATANAFKHAADHLDDSETKKGNLFNANLPIGFLYRHAIELFLKSAIVIFHRRLEIPYGEAPSDAEPMLPVGVKWEPLHHLHSIEVLWTYVRTLFAEHSEWLARNTKANWTLSDGLDAVVRAIQQSDPRSTFFRYPTTKEPNADIPKSAMKEFAADKFAEILRTAKPAENKVILVVENDSKEIVRGYIYDDQNVAALNATLRDFANRCYDLHAAMRWELCGGR